MNLPLRCAGVLLAVLLAGCGTAVDVQPGGGPSAGRVGAWSSLPTSPLSARHEAAGAFLEGRFYVVGGWSDRPCPPAASCVAPAEPPHRDGAVYDLASGRWRELAPAPTPVGGVLEMTVVGRKLFLLTGDLGRDDSPVRFLSYDPDRNDWAILPTPPGTYPQLVAAGSQVLAIGGSDEDGPAVDAVFDPERAAWRRLPDDPLGPSYGRSAAWLGDRLLLTGSDLVPNPGADGPSLTRLAVLNESLTRWTLLPDSDIIGGNPVWVADRVMFPMTGSADGGEVGNWGRDYVNGAILDPATTTWSPLPQLRSGRSGLEGQIGNVGDRTLVGGQLLEPRSRAVTRLPSAPWGGQYRTSQTIATGPDSIVVWGGATDETNLAEGYLLRI